MGYIGFTLGKIQMPVRNHNIFHFPAVTYQIDFEPVDVLMDEWVVSSNFKPSNRKLVKKTFSTVLDHKPIDPKLWAAIKCPVMIIHGGE